MKVYRHVVYTLYVYHLKPLGDFRIIYKCVFIDQLNIDKRFMSSSKLNMSCIIIIVISGFFFF